MTNTTEHTHEVTRVKQNKDGSAMDFFEGRKKIETLVIPEDFDFTGWDEFIEELNQQLPLPLDMALAAVGDEMLQDGLEPGGLIKKKYRQRYGSEQNCGDEVAAALKAHTAVPQAKGRDKTDHDLLVKVQKANKIEEKAKKWLHLNPGLQQMNTSNVLRGMVRRGEAVTIGDTIWEVQEETK
jgi:hypothetical protein